jgi:hypothetical protein
VRRVQEVLDSLDADRQKLYADSRNDIERLGKAFSRGGISSERVARAVVRALTARSPRSRYRVGFDSWFLSTFSPVVPDRIRYWITRRVLSLK